MILLPSCLLSTVSDEDVTSNVEKKERDEVMIIIMVDSIAFQSGGFQRLLSATYTSIRHSNVH